MSDPLLVGRVAFVVFVALVAQMSVVASLPVAGARGDVVLLVVVAAAVVGGPARGATVGFCTGLTFDLLTSTPMGLSALVGTIVGYVIGSFAVSGIGVVRFARVIGVMAGSLGGVVLYAVLGHVVGDETFAGPSIATIALVVTLLNGLLAPLALRAMRWAQPVKSPDRQFSLR